MVVESGVTDVFERYLDGKATSEEFVAAMDKQVGAAVQAILKKVKAEVASGKSAHRTK